MRKVTCFIALTIVVGMCDMQKQSDLHISSKEFIDEISIYNEPVVSFVVFRHGDRTPDQEELDLFPSANIDDKVFFPHGKKALTHKGKQRSYLLGQYLRERYNDSISEFYLPEEISVRTTDFARTKMSALTVLAALYMPVPEQKWHPEINWQPIPYNTMPAEDDDLLYFSNCPRYDELRNKTYEIPSIRDKINSYKGLFELLNNKTGTNIETPQEVFYLDNLFQALENSGIAIPKWVQEIMPQIKNMTKIEYLSQYYNTDLIRLTSGVLMADILKITSAAIAGNKEIAKLYLYSGHELNVAGLLAALRVFVPHQPNYGSAVSLELRRNIHTNKYGVLVVYAPETGGPISILPIADCGGEAICDYEKFAALMLDVALSRSEFKTLCSTSHSGSIY